MKLMTHTVLAMIFILASTMTLAQGPAEDKSWLFVQTASSLSFDDQTLTIPYEREIFAFTDRPNREHQYLNAHEFQSLWGTGDNNFTQDPPNAVLTWVSDGEVMESEVVLAAADLTTNGRALVYTLGDSAQPNVPADAQHVSLFIDSMTSQAREYYREQLGYQ